MLLAAAISLVLHGIVLAGSWFAVERVIRLPAAAPEAAATALLLDPPRPDPLGLRDGLGDALAEMEADAPLESTLEGQNQPLLGMGEHGPLRPDQPDSRRLLQRAERRPPIPAVTAATDLAEAMNYRDVPQQPPSAMAGEAEPTQEADASESTDDSEQVSTDPGPASGREVDLFAQEASTILRAGSAEAREGRDHRIRGLRRSLNAFLDSFFLPRPIRAKFLIILDEEGTPTLIEVAESSGSRSLDLAIRRQLFKSWFDPDPSGDGSDLGRPFHFSLAIH